MIKFIRHLLGSIIPSVVLKIEDNNREGGWADLLRTQMKEFKPLYMIPNYTDKYEGYYAHA